MSAESAKTRVSLSKMRYESPDYVAFHSLERGGEVEPKQDIMYD
ncbi:hypothetical protein ACSAZL_13405 [Methanosarcina sp. T3]